MPESALSKGFLVNLQLKPTLYRNNKVFDQSDLNFDITNPICGQV